MVFSATGSLLALSEVIAAKMFKKQNREIKKLQEDM